MSNGTGPIMRHGRCFKAACICTGPETRYPVSFTFRKLKKTALGRRQPQKLAPTFYDAKNRTFSHRTRLPTVSCECKDNTFILKWLCANVACKLRRHRRTQLAHIAGAHTEQSLPRNPLPTQSSRQSPVRG